MPKFFMMTPDLRSRMFTLACAFLLFGTFNPVIAAEQTATTAVTAQPKLLDSTARLLAGLPPSNPEHAELARSKAWTAHARTIQASWTRARDGQLAAMKSWRTTNLPKGCPVGNTLFYPFSGPDFLNAHVFFPDCDNYVLFGLEPVGAMPDLSAMKAPEFAKLLADVRRTMINLFDRNYFVTTTMNKDLKSKESLVQGVLPVLTIAMALANVEVISIGHSPFPPAANGKRKLDGVSIDFRAPGSPKTKRLIFYSLDASNKGLADYPEFEKYLRGLTPTTTLIKSASYLLHITEFSQMRNVLLDTSTFLLQDDTGLPYGQLRKHDWQVQPYGTYGVPISPFKGHHQKELAAAFSTGAKPLPFRFGYQRNEEKNHSGLILARRITAAQQSGAKPR